MWQDNLKAKWSQWKSFRFHRTGERTRKGVMFRLQEQGSKVRSKIEAGLWGNFLSTCGQSIYRNLLIFLFSLPFCQIWVHSWEIQRATTILAHSSSKKLLYFTHTYKKKKVKKNGEASQTTAKSKWSQLKKEIGNTTRLEVSFACAAQPSSTGNASRIFTANSSAWKLSKYLLNPQAADWGLFNPWTFILSFKP